MDFSIKSGNPEKQRSACVVVGVYEPRKLSAQAEAIDKVSQGYLSDIVRRGDMEGKLNSTLLLHNVPNALSDRVLLIGLGKERDFHEKEYQSAVRTAIKHLNETGSMEANFYLTELAVGKRDVAWRVGQAVITAMASVYRFDRFKSKPEEVRRPLRKLTLNVARRPELAPAERGLAQGLAIAEGIGLSKDLGNLPPNVCTPTYLAGQAVKLAKEHKLKVEILDREAIEKLGMGSFLSVARGSRQPPKLIVLQYFGADKKTQPVVLVGKGIT
ncbi:MAG: leucyl aminopeptidase, partial [Burkholderiales bacterium]|nr:leucyl aminopeptidase [Burkholderiales bacterium]